MKKILLAALPVAALAIISFNIKIDKLPIGSDMPNPDLKMKDVSGKDITLKGSLKKNGLLVMFSCNTCPYVIKNQERTLRVTKSAAANDMGVVLINSNEGGRDGGDSYEAMKEYAKKQGYAFHYVVDTDSKMADAFDANRTPECFLFNKEGKLVYHGAIDDNPANARAVTRNHLDIAMEELVAGKDIAVKETRSVGCGIKRKD
jgi:cytochrome oxidase Cu insertion factor (SCO1/SenC/PrrC family)